MREVALVQPDRRPPPPRRDDVLRVTLAAGPAGYRASMRHVQESRFGDERDLAVDIPFSLPQRDLLALRGDRTSYGARLTDAFFADYRLHAAWQKVHYLVEGTGRRLQVRIEIEPSAPELHHICWETLQDPERHRFLAQNTRTPVVRYIQASGGVPLIARPRAQLRALVVVAGARPDPGYNLPMIDVAAEVERIRSALGPIPTTLLGVAIADAPPASIAQIRAALREPYAIVYVVCHGVLAREQNGEVQPYLWLENAQGRLAPVKAQQLVDIIAELDGPLRPNLIVFSSCQSAEDEDELAPRRPVQAAAPIAVAPSLAAAGVSAVIGMQGLVSQQFVARFFPTLFEQLFAGEPIDSALATARADNGDADWWVPVLYLRGDNPYLWQPADEQKHGEPLLPGLLAGVAVHEVLRRFQHDLRRACAHLPLLKAYKDIHDQLHLLLIRGIRCIELNVAPRLAEPSARLEFESYYRHAQMSLRLLHDATAQLPQGNGELRTVAQLARSYERMAAAVERKESKALSAAIAEISSSLATLPVSTNLAIVEQVRVLRIDELSRMLLELQNTIDAGVQPLIAARAQELRQLEVDLGALVSRHSEWQGLDKVLRFLEQYGDPTLIPYHWETLQLQVAAVLQLEPPEIQAALLGPTASLEQAITAGDERRIPLALDALALEVRLRFFALDKQLKERCDGIQSLGAEFKLLLDMLTP